MSFSKQKPIIFALLGVAAVFGALFSVRAGMDALLRQDAWLSGMELAGYIEHEMPALDRILSREVTPEEGETVLGQAAAIGKAYRFEFFDRHGALAFATGSYHPTNGSTRAAHHAHSHVDVAPAGDAPAARLSRSPEINDNGADPFGRDGHAAGRPQSNATHEPAGTDLSQVHSGRHQVRLHSGNGRSEPLVYAEIIHPMADEDGAMRGTIRLLVDQTERSTLFTAVLFGSSAVVVLFFLIGFGVPTFSYLTTLRAKREADERAHYLARHDSLTGLANRNSFVAHLDDALSARRPDEGALTAIHLVDVDRFKQLNDTLGHDVGDACLRTVASGLIRLQGNSVFIARLGGDEFAVVQDDLMEEAEADAMAASIVDCFSRPISLESHTVRSTVSVGTAIYPSDGSTVSRLMKSADIALYQAKTGGRNAGRRFEPWMDEQLTARRRLEAQLRVALETESLELHYQPIFNAAGTDIKGFEALARLKDESGAYVPPASFIPVAERMGLISEIGSWVIHRACAFAAQWPDHLSVAINLSPGEFHSAELVATVKHALAAAGLAAHRLELEITESLLMSDTDAILTQLSDLKALGTSIVMDDFGTGYSSLGYLWKFPFDKIKIDRSFMQGFESDSEKIGEILKTIVSLGHSMKMSVTAEGVETEQQADRLRALDCDELQGFLLGRPQPESETSGTLLKAFKKAELETGSRADRPEAKTGRVA